MPYQYLEDTATADIAFEAWGTRLEETFISAAEATMNVMIEELEMIRQVESLEIVVEHEELDLLLFNLLQEIIFYKDARQLLLRLAEVTIVGTGGTHHLRAVARGEKLDPDRHAQRVDVKAVTLHDFRLEQVNRGWRAHVILDI